MKNPTIPPPAVLALALGGCGGDDRAETVTPPSPTTAASPAGAQADTIDSAAAEGELGEALLTLSDLPSGWSTSPPDEDTEDDVALCDVATIDAEDATLEQHEASFQQSDFGPFLANTIGRMESADAVSAWLDDLRDAASSCSSWTDVDEQGEETTWRVSGMSFPKVGDRTLAFRLAGESPFGPIVLDLVAWQRDDVLVGLFTFGFGNGVAADELEGYARTVNGRL